MCVRIGLAVHGRAVFHKAVALVPFVDRLHEGHDKRRRKDVEAQQTQRHGEAAGIDRAEQRQAVGEAARLHVLHAKVERVQHGRNAAVAHDLLTDIGVVLHVFEKGVFVAAVVEPCLALNLVEKLDVGRVEIVEAADQEHRHPAHGHQGA